MQYKDKTHARNERMTRVLFWGLCGYLASQAFQIPIAAIGPSWALWPTLSDLAFGCMCVGFILGRRHCRMNSWTNRKLFRILLFVLIANTGLLFSTFFISAVGGQDGRARTANAGVFQLFRLWQFFFLFRIVSGIPLTPRRLKLMSWIIDAVLVAVFAGVVGTFTSAISTRSLVSHLPSDWGNAGPWGYMSAVQLSDVGTIGYNHAYTAVQLIMLTVLGMNLTDRPKALKDSFYVILCTAGVMLSGSRAGMAAVLFILVLFFIRKPQVLMTSSLILLILLVAGAGLVLALVPDLHATIERQLTLGDPMQADNLSGRQYIWKTSLDFIQQDPVRWIIGAGPGSVAEQQSNAHMLYLHIVMEAGLIGLIVFCFAFYRIIIYLSRHERRPQPILLATLALLLSSATQETFYPVPSFGHFLGFYLFSLALAVRLDRKGNSLPTAINADRSHRYARYGRYSVLQR